MKKHIRRYFAPYIMTTLFLIVLAISIWIPLQVMGTQDSDWKGSMAVGMLAAICLGAIAGFTWEDALHEKRME